jgi:hypothetical protein
MQERSAITDTPHTKGSPPWPAATWRSARLSPHTVSFEQLQCRCMNGVGLADVPFV